MVRTRDDKTRKSRHNAHTCEGVFEEKRTRVIMRGKEKSMEKRRKTEGQGARRVAQA